MNSMRYCSVLAIVLVVSACADLRHLKSADNAIVSGQAIQALESANLSASEIAVIHQAVDKYMYFAVSWREGEVTKDDMEHFTSDYKILQAEYLAVDALAVKHWSEYNEATQKQLAAYRELAHKVDADIAHAVKLKQWAEAAKRAVHFAITAVKIAGAIL